jgi:hypothetical protein
MHAMIRGLITILICMVLLPAELVHAQIVRKQLLVQTDYQPEGLRRRVPEEARKDLEALARQRAYAAYLSENCPPAKRQLLESFADEVMASLESVVPQVQILDERINAERRIIEASVTAQIDSGRLDAIIAQKTRSNAQTDRAIEKDDFMVFLFVARKIGAITTSDGKRVEFTKTTTQEAEVEGMQAGSSGIETEYSLESLEIKEYGGKSIDKAQSVEWIIESVSSVDAAVNETFTQAGFEPVDPNDVDGFDVDAFRADYGTGDDVRPETRREANSLLRDYEVAYFATGRMDIALPQVHPVTGLPQVYVRVEARVTDLTARLPRTVASVSGEYYQGVGPNVQVATQNALLLAARETSSKLVNQLRARGM